jgi:glutamate synthase domain-containing protein 3
MSGGLAFVLDEDDANLHGRLEERATTCTRANLHGCVNGGLVDVEPIDAEDAEIVRALVVEHVAHTRSRKGAEVLAAWDDARFVKIVPREYRRAEIAAARLKVVS